MTPYNRGAFERVVREADGGPPLAERPAPTSENFKRMQEGLTRLSERYGGQKYIFGDSVTYADFIIASFLVMLVAALPDEEKNQVLTWNDGRWKTLLDEFENAGYLATDHGELYVPKD
jgi:glutathione S-transferase